MKGALLLTLGVVGGGVVAGMLMKSSSCCLRVGAGVRDEVGSKLGAGAQSIGDALDLWKYAPGLLDLFGVK